MEPVEKEHDANGTLKSAGRRRNGKRHGPWRFYHRDGKLWSSGTYDNGVANGFFNWFASNGTLRKAGRFEAGKQVGIWRRHYGRTSPLYDVGRYAEAKRVGVWKAFDRRGRLARTRTFSAPEKG